MQAKLEQNVLLNDDDVSAILNHMESSQDIVLNAVDEMDFSPEDTALHSMGSLGMKQVGIATDYRPIEKELKGLFFQTFNSMTLGISWKELDAQPQLWETMQAQVRWCYSNGFPLTFGPLVNFSKEHLPKKVLDMKGHFEDICLCVRAYVEQVVKRFRPYVGAWIATSCVNSCFALGLTVMEQLEITAQVMQLIHELHPTSEVTTSFDQPWGDNILPAPLGAAETASNTMSPLECADLLLQTKLKISAFRLEFNVGYGAHATYNRHPAQWIRLLERWSLFGKPLFLSFSVPSSCNADEKARFHTAPLWDGWTPKQQTQWAAIVLPALMAKPSVAGIDWNGLRDYRTHDYPHGGLISTTGHVKKVQALLAELQKYFSNET